MAEDQAKPKREYAKRQAATAKQSATPASTAKKVVAQNPSKPRDPAVDQAVAEFAKIATSLRLANVPGDFKPSRNGCERPPKWCLPDIACAARVTLSQNAIDALEKHLKDCTPPVQ